MNLMTGKLLWPYTIGPIESYPTLNTDIDCDTLVIGCGISGAAAAYELSKRGQRVVVLEKRQVGHGSTSANTGLLQFCNDKHLTSCIHSFGEDKGVRFYRLCQQAVKRLIHLSDELVMDPMIIPRSSLYTASSEEDVEMLRAEYETLRKYDFPVEWWTSEVIQAAFGFVRPAAIVTHGDAEVNPFLLLHALLRTAVSQYDLQIYENTEAMRYHYEPDRIIVETSDGHHITAKHAIIAMGYEAQELKRDRNAVIQSTYAMITEPIHGLDQVWHKGMLFWESARPYFYMRTTSDHRIVAGGYDTATANAEERDGMLPHKTKLLVQQIEELFPSLTPIQAEYAWAAEFVSTHDGYPLIGKHEDYPHCLFIENYGGNGTAYAVFAAAMISDMIEHGAHPDEDLFRFDRPAYASTPLKND